MRLVRPILPHLLLLAAMWAWSAATWDDAPPIMPIHWGFDGQPDGFGTRAQALTWLPAVTTALFVFLEAFARLPAYRVVPGVPAMMRRFSLLLVAMFASAHVGTALFPDAPVWSVSTGLWLIGTGWVFTTIPTVPRDCVLPAGLNLPREGEPGAGRLGRSWMAVGALSLVLTAFLPAVALVAVLVGIMASSLLEARRMFLVEVARVNG
jgi:hypothetical protein